MSCPSTGTPSSETWSSPDAAVVPPAQYSSTCRTCAFAGTDTVSTADETPSIDTPPWAMPEPVASVNDGAPSASVPSLSALRGPSAAGAGTPPGVSWPHTEPERPEHATVTHKLNFFNDMTVSLAAMAGARVHLLARRGGTAASRPG